MDAKIIEDCFYDEQVGLDPYVSKRAVDLYKLEQVLYELNSAIEALQSDVNGV